MAAMRARSLLGWVSLIAAACNGGTNNGGTGARTDAAAMAPAPAPTPGGTGTDPAIAMIQGQIDAAHVDKSSAEWRTSLTRPAVATFTPGRSYLWTLVTSKGELRLKLLPEAAPMHVTSTIYLTLLGFYDSLIFHRIIKGFMAQGGDPLGNGRGSPGYAFAVEVSAAARHDARGVLSMANAGPGTEGSQFFITFAPQPNLDGKYSVFGNLVAGMDTLTAIEAAGTAGEGKPGPVTITSATISVE
jgi:peptidyl-prolyl cis-trans isomerase B (cyclophilin B)